MAQAQNLTIEADDCVTLTPESPRYKGAVQQYRPQTIAEVRKILGPSAPSGTGTPTFACCLPLELSAALPDPRALNSKDDAVRFRAREQAMAVASLYVRAADIGQLRHFEPLLDRYIQLTRPILISFVFADIDIAHGATLTLAANTHVLLAANIRMRGTGRIVCRGPTTLRANTINGNIGTGPVDRPDLDDFTVGLPGHDT